jgi:hypothetical protein
LDWAEEYKYSTVVLSQLKQLLAEHQRGMTPICHLFAPGARDSTEVTVWHHFQP